MNPDIYSLEYQIATARSRIAARAEAERRAALHEKAVARRRKAKRGGKR